MANSVSIIGTGDEGVYEFVLFLPALISTQLTEWSDCFQNLQ